MKTHTSLLLIWAGLAMGGNLIAAPAKFQVDALSTAELLQVGRAQFEWLGWAETGLALLVLLACALARHLPRWPVLAALAVFALQQGVLQPLLEARSDVIIGGGAATSSHLHIVFIAAEMLKIGLLLWASLKDPGAGARPPANSRTP